MKGNKMKNTILDPKIIKLEMEDNKFLNPDTSRFVWGDAASYTVTFTAEEINWDTEGTKDDDGKAIMGLLFPEFLEEMAWKLTEGYEKYGYKNYMKDLDELRIISAAFRHFMHVMKGDEPPEGEHSHEAAVAVNMMMLYEKRIANDNNDTNQEVDEFINAEGTEKLEKPDVRSYS